MTEAIAVKDSILASIKKLLGIEDSYTQFDPDLIMHINAVLDTLQQLAVGPEDGVFIEDRENAWSELIPAGSKTLRSVKTFIYYKVKLGFDPPATGPATTAMEKLAAELEWRLNVKSDPYRTPPYTVPVDDATAGHIWTLNELGEFPDEANIGDLGVWNGLLYRKTGDDDG